jgi:hypothetical protein
MSSAARAAVLSSYRELLRLTARLPEAQRARALDEARSALRAHAAEPSEARQLDLRKRLAARISFLRAVTPRMHGEASAYSDGGGGRAHYVLRGGQLVEGRGAQDSRCARRAAPTCAGRTVCRAGRLFLRLPDLTPRPVWILGVGHSSSA